ncbi:MAG: ABC transporter substrate-binding protein [Desulfobacteraceae bacterium]|nr:ABC transporter substrate-binding protein [Desulfobacteraceae bacterium]
MKNKSIFQLPLYFSIFLFICLNLSISAETIKIGQSLPLSGENSESANQFQKGSLCWIKYINSRGGVNSNTIELITRDDSGDYEKAVKNTEFFILENFFMLYGYMGYDSCLNSYEISKKSKIPFFGASTGAQELQGKGESIFFTRPDYSTETINIIEMLLNHEKNKIALFHSQKNWAKSFAKSAAKSLDAKNIKDYSLVSVSQETPDTKSAAEKINLNFPDAVIIAADSDTASSFIRDIRKINPKIIIIASSEVNGEELSKKLMNQGVGVIISQVVPFPFYTKLPVVQLYKRILVEYFPEEPLSFYGLEGFISARAMTTIISGCKQPLNRENFIDTAASLKSVNLGGFVLDFTDNKSTGSTNSYFTQIGPGGFLTPITSLDDIYKYSPL